MTIEQLIERVEKAEGPDREIDALVAELFDLPDCVGPDCFPEVFRNIIARVKAKGFGSDDPDVAFYSSSIDAVVRLIETCLPATEDYAKGAPPSSGYKIGLYRGPTPTRTVTSAHWTCMLRRHGQDAGYDHYAKTPALALLLGFLRAYKEQSNDR